MVSTEDSKLSVRSHTSFMKYYKKYQQSMKCQKCYLLKTATFHTLTPNKFYLLKIAIYCAYDQNGIF